MSAYPIDYLDRVQDCVGGIFHIGCVARSDYSDIETFVTRFLRSDAVFGIEHGDPFYLAGSSDVEWYLAMLREDGISYTKDEILEMWSYPDRMYWCGWVAAYYQWLRSMPFKDILIPGMVTELAGAYYPLHEADISQVVDYLDCRLAPSSGR